MAIKTYKPRTPGQRFKSTSRFEDLAGDQKPVKGLLAPSKKTGGRNSYGRITARRRGGGHKRMIRVLDYRRDKIAIPAKVTGIQYDPNRSARIALLQYIDGEKRYILAPDGLCLGMTVTSGAESEITVGNALPLANIPMGTIIHNIEVSPGKGGQIARTAGAQAQLVAKEKGFGHIKMPSTEVRRIRLECMATIGQVGNTDHENIKLGKAGRARWLGKRPKVRGVAMNPVDHPMGGGEGKSSGGRHPCTPWGKPTKGYRTRKKNKASSRYIVRRRKA